MFDCKNAEQKNSQNGNIVFVSYRYTVGMGGAESITATKDSLISETWGRTFQDVPNFTKKIDENDWKKLINSIDLKILENAVNGEMRGVYDGPDQIFTIKTSEKEYSFTNVRDSVSARQLNAIKLQLKNMVSQKK
jgi:hypothetical protein